MTPPPPRIRILMICELKLGFIVDFVYLLVKIQGSFTPTPFPLQKQCYVLDNYKPKIILIEIECIANMQKCTSIRS